MLDGRGHLGRCFPGESRLRERGGLESSPSSSHAVDDDEVGGGRPLPESSADEVVDALGGRTSPLTWADIPASATTPRSK